MTCLFANPPTDMDSVSISLLSDWLFGGLHPSLTGSIIGAGQALILGTQDMLLLSILKTWWSGLHGLVIIGRHQAEKVCSVLNLHRYRMSRSLLVLCHLFKKLRSGLNDIGTFMPVYVDPFPHIFALVTKLAQPVYHSLLTNGSFFFRWVPELAE